MVGPMMALHHARVIWIAMILCVATLVQTVASRVASTPQASEPSAEQGYLLSQRLCQGCHVISNDKQASAIIGIPTFRSIADRPGQTSERIKRLLIKPHAPMPDMHLTIDEIMHIIAYLETLRTDRSSPPLLPPTGIDRKPEGDAA